MGGKIMSQYEVHVGKVEKVDLLGLFIEDFCKEACNKRNITELKDYYDSGKNVLEMNVAENM